MLINTLQVNQLHCIRQGKPLFVDMSWQLQAGGALLVTGENGTGKSSLLRLLTGLATPASGNVQWGGMPIQQIRTEYAEQLHYVGHANGVKLGLTVRENLELAILLCSSGLLIRYPERGKGSPVNHKKILRCAQDDKISAHDDKINVQDDRINVQNDILTQLNLHSCLNTLTKHLSAGQKRRLALAKLFLVSKPLWIIDEPLTALDSAMQAFFLVQLQQHLKSGGIAVISSHHSIDLASSAIKELRLSTC